MFENATARNSPLFHRTQPLVRTVREVGVPAARVVVPDRLAADRPHLDPCPVATPTSRTAVVERGVAPQLACRSAHYLR